MRRIGTFRRVRRRALVSTSQDRQALLESLIELRAHVFLEADRLLEVFAVQMLTAVLERMQGHPCKKTSRLRALHAWDGARPRARPSANDDGAEPPRG